MLAARQYADAVHPASCSKRRWNTHALGDRCTLVHRLVLGPDPYHGRWFRSFPTLSAREGASADTSSIACVRLRTSNGKYKAFCFHFFQRSNTFAYFSYILPLLKQIITPSDLPGHNINDDNNICTS